MLELSVQVLKHVMMMETDFYAFLYNCYIINYDFWTQCVPKIGGFHGVGAAFLLLNSWFKN